MIGVYILGGGAFQVPLKKYIWLADLGIKTVYAVGNKVVNETHSEFMRRELKDIPLLGTISYNKTLIDSDLQGKAAYSDNERLLSEVSEIMAKLKECVK